MVGKTIKNYKIKKYKGYDDEPLLEIEFTDGTFVYIEAAYGGYTGESLDEYPSIISVSEVENKKRTHIPSRNYSLDSNVEIIPRDKK